MRPTQQVHGKNIQAQEQRNAPRLYQAMEVLELSWPALMSHIEQALTENPALELEEPDDLPPQEPLPAQGSQDPEDQEFYRQHRDWSSVSINSAAWDTPDDRATLATHLHSALGMTILDPTLKYLAEIIIDSLTDSGLLELPLADLLAVASQGAEGANLPTSPSIKNLTHQDVQAALGIVQSLGVPGIGARDLPECLLLQLKAMPQNTGLAQKIISCCLPELTNHQYELVAKKTAAPLKEVRKAVSMISQLNPRPGSEFNALPKDNVRPEIAFAKKGGVWIGELIEYGAPHLKISRQYSQMAAQHKGLDEETKEYLTAKISSARNLLEAIEQRKRTMKMVAMEIARRQANFLAKGVKALEPMTMEQLATSIGVHKSTVSRVCKDRYAQTPFGVWPMKRFFGSGVSTSDGEGGSAESIKAIIKALVKNENSQKPISDTDLQTLLQGSGISIARRTVAKYREGAGIPPARQRKS